MTDLIDPKDKAGTLQQTNDIKAYLKNRTVSLDANLGGYLVCKSVLNFMRILTNIMIIN